MMSFARILALALASAVFVGNGAGAATLTVVGQEVDFSDDQVLMVEIEIGGAADVAGIDFSIAYPGDLLAVDSPSTHVSGGLFPQVQVNHDADPTGLPEGMRRIGVAMASEAAIGVDGGTLLTVSFPLRCSDYSGDWPEGRPLTISIAGASAWDDGGAGLPNEVELVTADGDFLLNCTTVSAGSTGFSTLKARHAGGIR